MPIVQAAAQPVHGTTAKVLHWLVAALVAAQFAVAWTMPDIHRGTPQGGLIDLHLSLGVLIMMVMAYRAVWRLTQPFGGKPDARPALLRRTGQLAHLALYLLLFSLPLAGWANASFRGWSVSLLGLIKLPQITAAGAPLGHSLGSLHGAMATALLIGIGLHVLAALYHHLVLRDGVLRQMLPSLPAKSSEPQ